MARKRLGEILIEAGLINSIQLQSALEKQRRTGRQLGITLVEMGLVEENDMVRLLSAQLSIPAVDLDTMQFNPVALKKLGHEFCLQYLCIPFNYQNNGHFLDVATSDPTNLSLIDRIRVETKCNVHPHLAGSRSIEKWIHKIYLNVDIAPAAVKRINSSEQHMYYRSNEVVLDPADFKSGDAHPIVQAPERRLSGLNQSIALSTIESVTQNMSSAGEALSGFPLEEVRQEVAALKEALGEIRDLLKRDEDVLRKFMSLLVKKKLLTKEEVMANIAQE